MKRSKRKAREIVIWVALALAFVAAACFAMPMPALGVILWVLGGAAALGLVVVCCGFSFFGALVLRIRPGAEDRDTRES